MIIPLPFTWGHALPIGQQDQIDRAVQNRNYRLIAGLGISENWEQIHAVLLISTGHGKFIRCRHVVETSVPIPLALKKSCLEFVRGSNQDCGQLQSILADLAAVQASAVDRLKIEAGKYVDRILAVSIADPGLWRSDFDGREMYTSFCDATRLAELSGVTVIDNFPAADLAAGGCGRSLEALPFWLLAADRDERVARREKFVLDIGPTTSLLRLPVSDGRDAELPAFERWRLESTGFVPDRPESNCRERTQVQRHQQPHSPSANQLVESMWPILRQSVLNRKDTAALEVLLITDPSQAEELSERIRKIDATVSGSAISSLGLSAHSVPATVAALLGLMHIDQFPANVPWLTGAHSQRILGRPTLGRPSNWRQLVRTMADYHPAAMKLKDAV